MQYSNYASLYGGYDRYGTQNTVGQAGHGGGYQYYNPLPQLPYNPPPLTTPYNYYKPPPKLHHQEAQKTTTHHKEEHEEDGETKTANVTGTHVKAPHVSMGDTALYNPKKLVQHVPYQYTRYNSQQP